MIAAVIDVRIAVGLSVGVQEAGGHKVGQEQLRLLAMAVAFSHSPNPQTVRPSHAYRRLVGGCSEMQW